MLRSIRKLFKFLTNILGISYNIDKGKNANSSRAVLCVDVKKVNVFRKGLKRLTFAPNHYCSYCFKSIPAGSDGFIHSGYGSQADITADKVKLFLHVACVGEITGSEEILSRYVKTLRPSRDELEALLKAQMNLQDLLEDPKAIHHEGGCILWSAKPNDLRWEIDVDGVPMDIHKAAFLLAGNTYETGNVIRHTCDVPNCFNPDHLIEGTGADNMADAVRRGRRKAGTRKLDPVKRAEQTLEERSERLRLYGNPDWFEGWDDNHHIEQE